MKQQIFICSLILLSFLCTACGAGEEKPLAMSEERLSEEVSLSFSPSQYRTVLATLEGLDEDLRSKLSSQLEESLQEAEENEIKLTLPVGYWHEVFLEYQRWSVKRDREPRSEPGDMALFALKLRDELEKAGYPIEENPVMAEWIIRFMELSAEREYKTNEVSLRVVDEEGELIEGVDLFISRNYPDFLSWDTRRETEEVRVDGTHRFSTEGASGVRVRGRKEGYYSNHVFFTPEEQEEFSRKDTQLWEKIVLGKEITDEAKADAALLEKVLELRKRGEIVQLYRFDGELEIRADGSGQIVQLKIPGDHPPGRLLRERDGIWKDVDNIRRYMDEEAQPEDIAMFTSFEDGEIESPVTLIVATREQQFPEKIILQMGDPEGGFYLIPEAPNEVNARQFDREMNEAPEGVYEQRIELSAEDIQKRGGFFVFIKTNDRFGKGFLHPINRLELDKEVGKVSYTFRFSLNPNPGDRNLEDGR